MKKALILLFTLCMVAVLFVPSATAAETVSSGTCGENVTWTLDGTGTLTISGTGDLKDWCSIVFAPNKANPGSLADNLYIGGELITCDLVIPDGVTSIGDYAFDDRPAHPHRYRLYPEL